MSLSIIYSRGCQGIHAPLVSVEVDLANGLPSFSIVGLPETAVKESKDRVRSAIRNSGFEFPTRRITVNLAPADLPKEGGRYDLPIAMGVLAASGQIPTDRLQRFEFVGELALSGELRPIKGVLPIALACAKQKRRLVVPENNADEAALISGLPILASDRLTDLIQKIQSDSIPSRSRPAIHPPSYPDLSDVRGQHQARRALLVAAAGRHNLLMVGPPGTGKSMLAARFPGLLPPMTEAEAIESAAVASIDTGHVDVSQWKCRPIRNPHHSASSVSLVGGGSNPKPGEISRAHNGVLFLDEFPEFDRRTLEALREPLETGEVTIVRANTQARFPAQFQLIAAMNPCKCGYLGDGGNSRCRCTAEQVQNYRNRLSGPLLDRIDMHIEVPRVPHSVMRGTDNQEEPSALVRNRVIAAHKLQLQRQGTTNHQIEPKHIEHICALDNQGYALLETASERLGLSARAYHRILKVARTIADLAESELINTTHLSEAIGYRKLNH